MAMNKILDVLRKSNKIAITFHVSPDGDSIGSSLALFQGLKKLNKDVYILSKEDVPETFKFLPYSLEVSSTNSEVLPNTDCVVVLDCGDFKRINGNIDKENGQYSIINIDHHVSNELYGSLNFVDKTAACVGEIIYKILRSLEVDIDDKIGSCLYTSILTDTGSFRHSNTTAITHNIAGELINTGIDFSEIHRKVFNNKEFYRFKLYASVFNDMKLINNKICLMKITKDMLFSLNNCEIGDTSDVVSFGMEVGCVEVAVLIKEKEDEFKISLRSKSILDVRKVAENFGGGGHVRASGCTIKNKSLQEVEKMILEAIEEELIQ